LCPFIYINHIIIVQFLVNISVTVNSATLPAKFRNFVWCKSVVQIKEHLLQHKTASILFVLTLKILTMANDATLLLDIGGDETHALKFYKI
jgi:hypothetical protein